MPPDVPAQSAGDSRFTWSAEEIRRVGHRVVDLIAEHLTKLPAGPVFDPVPAELAEAFLEEPAPVTGEPADLILDRFARDVASHPFGNGHPRFYGWVNSPPAVMGVFAESLAAAMNPSVAGGNHGAVWVERQVVEWFKQLLGFPREGMGLLVSGGSAAAITGLAVARHVACARIGWNVREQGLQGVTLDGRATRLVIYKSGEGHGCNQKAIELLGLGSANLRTVPTDPALRMRPEALETMLTEDLEQGNVPVAVVASAGTVNTGAVDPLDALADLCGRHGVWLHVDGAYGAPAILTDQYRDSLSALCRADSVAVDPHKWLYVPVDAGLVLVKNAGALRDAFSLVPPYLRTDGNLHGVQGPPWFSEFGLEQTRPFRALKVWMALRYFGVEGYRTLVEHDLALARHLVRRVRETADFELWDPPGMSVVCFRAVPPGLRGDPAAVDDLNRAALATLQLGGEGFLTSTVLDERLWLRACFVNPRATTDDIDAVFGALRAALARDG
jgi:glutamate/tyrosine decarboxylase-like PLP-dependent enzyme